MDKVKLPHKVAEAIEKVWDNYPTDAFEKHMLLTNWSLLKDRHTTEYEVLTGYACHYPVEYMKALVNGYEVEERPEDKVRRYYVECKNSPDPEFRSERYGIRNTLNILGIKIKGVND